MKMIRIKVIFPSIDTHIINKSFRLKCITCRNSFFNNSMCRFSHVWSIVLFSNEQIVCILRLLQLFIYVKLKERK